MATTALLTADDLLELPDDGLPHELVKGELRTMTPAGLPHGTICGLISTRIGLHVLSHRLGVVATEATGFKLARDPDTLRCPDVSFISNARVPPDDASRRFMDGAPDLAIEVLSPDDTVFEIEEKVEEYLAAGARAVWVVNPKLRRVTIHAPGAAPRILHEGDSLDGGEILPGFTCPVRDIFSWPA